LPFSFADLPWLPEAPSDFSSRCRAANTLDTPVGETLHYLAQHAAQPRQAVAFRRALDKALEAGADLGPLLPFKLGIVSNATMDFIADDIPLAAARHGVAVEIVVADFDQVMQEALNPESNISRSGADAILLAIDYRWLGLESFDPNDGAARAQLAIERLLSAADALRVNAGAPIILPLLPRPSISLFGNSEMRIAEAASTTISEVNAAILDYAGRTGSYVLDVAHLASRIGLDRWHDPVQWFAYKLPFAADCNAAFAEIVGRLLGSIRGKSRKCLVLDLDNTLWGGAIGDEGLAKIVLGPGSAKGEAFLAVQHMAKQLRQRGIILSVCSKNDDEVARSPFREHPEMLLKESDIAIFQSNWTDKASNLEAIAKSLNIGLDSLVFLDDNPAERAHVRSALPSVAVPELPNDPAWFPWHLQSAGYFEATDFNVEDRSRAESYATNALRADVEAKSRNLGDYLSSLEMKLVARPFDQVGRARITQLINKTNQFNLTTRRLTEFEVVEVETADDRLTIQVSLSDRFGELGMIGLIICALAGDHATITDWVMSCRVLGRNVEMAMLQVLKGGLEKRGIREISAQYRPTSKNGMVKDHFDNLGFRLVKEEPEGARHYRVRPSEIANFALPMAIDDSAFQGG
jgi:FkbH-like protein